MRINLLLSLLILSYSLGAMETFVQTKKDKTLKPMTTKEKFQAIKQRFKMVEARLLYIEGELSERDRRRAIKKRKRRSQAFDQIAVMQTNGYSSD